MGEFIYTMKNVRKAIGDKVILDDVTMAFYPGAKIGVVGPNGAGDHQYYGPQPPAGHGEHHYYFWVYALDTNVEGTPTREAFLDTYAGNIIEQNRIVGLYENK